MIITVFRARLRPEHTDEYYALVGTVAAEADAMPGFVSRKVFIAEDGERVTIVEFESMEAHRAWAEHPTHVAAQRLGREKFYSDYNISICEVTRNRVFRWQG